MKLFVCFLLTFTIVFAQDGVTDGPDPRFGSCYAGSIENGTGITLERECDFLTVCF